MTEQALDEILDGFESGTFPRVAWHHGAHLAVAGCYLVAHPYDEALTRMRRGVIRYNMSVGIENSEDCGYHETLTRFWLIVGAKFLASQPSLASRAEKVTALVDAYGTKRDLFKQFYSYDVVKSQAARRDWIAPDAKSLEL